MSLGYTLSLLFSGWLNHKIGLKKSIILGISILAIALFSLTFASSYAYFASVALLMGLGAGIYIPSAIPILTSTIRPEKWGKAIAFHETAASCSILAIPLLTAVILRYSDWTVLVFALCGGCLMAVFAFSILSPDPRQKDELTSGYFAVLRRKDFWIMAILWGFAGSSGMGLYNIIPLFLVTEKGVDLGTANAVLGFSRLGGLVFTFVAGFMTDRFGTKRVLLFSLLINGASILGMALARYFPLLVSMLAVQGSFSSVFFPVGLVAISKITDFNERSFFTGAAAAFGVIFGFGLTPFILGAVADVWSFQVGIFSLGLFTAVPCVMLRKLRDI